MLWLMAKNDGVHTTKGFVAMAWAAVTMFALFCLFGGLRSLTPPFDGAFYSVKPSLDFFQHDLPVLLNSSLGAEGRTFGVHTEHFCCLPSRADRFTQLLVVARRSVELYPALRRHCGAASRMGPRHCQCGEFDRTCVRIHLPTLHRSRRHSHVRTESAAPARKAIRAQRYFQPAHL